MKIAWLSLVVAGILEVIWAVGLKYTEGWTKVFPSIITGLALLSSFYLLSTSLKTIPLGTAYAAWTGIGIVGATIAGIILFDEPKHLSRIFFISLIIIGIVGLKLTAGEDVSPR